MIKRPQPGLFLRFSLILILILACNSPARGQGHTCLTPLLINLDGWQAAAAEGMTMNTGSVNMITASRKYRHGKQELDAMIMVGNQPLAMGPEEPTKVDTAHSHLEIKKIKGFQVHTTLDKRENAGGIMVVLSKKADRNAMFVLTFKGMSDQDALAIAEQFDWQAMREKAQKLPQ